MNYSKCTECGDYYFVKCKKTMVTFNNDEKLKQQLITELEYHQEMDDVAPKKFEHSFLLYSMQIDGNALQKFSKKYHIDKWFTDITVKISKGLTSSKAKIFTLKAIEALPVGLDMNTVKSKWFKILLTDQLRFVNQVSEQEAAIRQHIDLFSEKFNTKFDKISLIARFLEQNYEHEVLIKKCIALFDSKFDEISESAARLLAESAKDVVARTAFFSAGSATYFSSLSAFSAVSSVYQTGYFEVDSVAFSAFSAQKAVCSTRSTESEAISEGFAESKVRSYYYTWMSEQFLNLFKN